MTVLPSPIPHPLDYCPFDVPGWAYEALEWVVGFDWPEGNEKATWEVADRWYAIAGRLTIPRDEAFDAASGVIAGYGGAGVTAQAFIGAWDRVAIEDRAPLTALLEIADELGKLVEECGRDIEGAKLEAWTEIGLFLIELIGMAVATALTLGAASPATGGLIAATRYAIQQIFKRLAEQLGRKAIKKTLKEAGERAAKQLTTREGLKHLGREAVEEGLDELREEAATNAGIQLYQNSSGRADGMDLADLGSSAAGGFAGGFAAAGAGVGRGTHSGVVRGMGAEVLGEFGGAAAGGELPDLEGVAKSASSGASGAALDATSSGVTESLLSKASDLDVPDLPAHPLDLAQPFGPVTPTSAVVPPGAPSDLSSPASPPASSSPSPSPAPSPVSASLASPSLAPPSLDSLSLVSSSLASPGSFSSPVSSPEAFSPTEPSAAAHAEAPPGSSDSAGASSPTSSTSSPSVHAEAAPQVDAESSSPTRSPWEAPPTATRDSISAGSPVLARDGVLSPDPGPSFSFRDEGGASPVTSGDTAASGRDGAVASSPPAGRDVGVGTPGRGVAADAGRDVGVSAADRNVAASPGSAGRGVAIPAPSGAGRDAPTASPAPAGRDVGVASPSGAGRDVASSGAGRDFGGAVGSVPVRPVGSAGSVGADGVERPGDRDGAAGVSGDSDFVAATFVPGPADPGVAPAVSAEAERYFEFAWRQRAAYAEFRRQDTIDALTQKAESARRRARLARRSARVARYVRLDPGLGQFFEADVAAATRVADRAEAQLSDLRDPAKAGNGAPVTAVEPQDWHRANRDSGQLAPGGVALGDRSMLTGSDHPPPVDRTRRYGHPAGLRTPLARHQLDLENAVPRDAAGNPVRGADPRTPYFRLVNDGGPAADPTRAINCQDCVLSFFDTYVHGRPRVSAPRTFDAYRDGDPQRPQYGEELGSERIEHATGGRLQSLCPLVAPDDPVAARGQVDRALDTVSAHLRAGGHGSFAFLINAWEGGAAHAWAAVNQNGEILFVDPQSGLVAPPGTPLYGHHGTAHPGNVIAIDALVVNGRGNPMPFPDHPDGLWRPQQITLPPEPRPAPVYYSSAYAGPEPPPPPPPPSPQEPERGPAPPTPTPPQPRVPAPRRPIDHIAEALEPPTPRDRIAEAFDPFAPRLPLDDTPTTSTSTSTSTSPADRGSTSSPPADAPTDRGSTSFAPADAVPDQDGTPHATDPVLDYDATSLTGRGLDRDMPVPEPSDDDAERRNHRDFLAHIRAAHEQNRRDEHAGYLIRLAETHRAKIHDLHQQADAADRAGSTVRADQLRTDARLIAQDVEELENQADSVRAGATAPPRTGVGPPDWTRLNDDIGTLTHAGVETGDDSVLTGDDDPPPIDRTRPYGKRGGLRPPLAVHQKDLERAMPRQADGRVHRLADPREGDWFALANDGGPAADPTRAINCVDGVLSLFDTYIHGRPRVAAPRTFDAYAEGDPTRPIGAEEAGLSRIEQTVGGEFQGLCPYVGSLPPDQAKSAVDKATTNLHNHLYNAGHGAFAFIVTESEQGTAHAWTAVNQNGTVLFLDPQTARVAESAPLYAHRGIAAPDNIVSMDALVVDNTGRPAPLPYHKAGLWSRSSLQPTGTASEPAEPGSAEDNVLTTLTTSQQATLGKAITAADLVATTELPRMQALAETLGAEVVDDEYRVKSLASLARKFAEREALYGTSIEEFLESSNDRVRFSVALPEDGYAEALRGALGHLRSNGYEILEVASFWGDGRGRHNGLNVTMRNPSGFRMELQFPTGKSREVGKLTHQLYEIVRLTSDDVTGLERVEAFLGILAINKMHDMPAHQPADVDMADSTVDTSLTVWATSNSGRDAWIAYRTTLASEGMSLRQALEHWTLEPDDVPGIERLDPPNERTDLHLPSVPEDSGIERGDEPDRLPGGGDNPTPSSDVARSPQAMDLRPRAGGETAVRRFIRERVRDSRPTDSGTPGTGTATDGTADAAGAERDVRGGGEDGLELRSAPGVAPRPTEDFDPGAEERRLLASLRDADRAAIVASVSDAASQAAQISTRLHEAVDALRSVPLSHPPEIVGEEHRVKTEHSLARAFAIESELEDMDVHAFLANTKDRVRFSIQVSEEDYVDSVEASLAELRKVGITAGKMVNFWGPGGRHNGLNVTMTDLSGFTFELQFPTARSRTASTSTHRSYEILRLKRAPAVPRARALLKMVRDNRDAGMAEHQPEGIKRLPITRTVDTTIQASMAQEPAMWREYARHLDRLGRSLDQELADYGLTRAEVLGTTRSDGEDDRQAVRLPDGPEVGHVRSDHEPDRLSDPPGEPVPGRDVERPEEGMDLRSGPGGATAVRRQVPRQDSDSRSADGGADRSGRAGDGAAERGDAPQDVRGGRADGLGIRPTPRVENADIAPGRTPGPLGPAFQLGAHYPDNFEYAHKQQQAERLAASYDVRALEPGNPDVILRSDETDPGSYADLQWLDPNEPADRDFPLRVQEKLRQPFERDPRIAVVVVDGQAAGLTIDGAVQGIRQLLALWREQEREPEPEQRMILFTGDGGSVVWRGDTGAINVSA
ncbi:toxin glutamine deamidase domain-containing protein [Actinoplanes sp. NPDC049681]|uniref:toxin glutamine deamidase domain-containing protein n=1 Tax=Actinoplanes sp. NPDC049681 TaxID=3363905 RepID=UPI0037951181